MVPLMLEEGYRADGWLGMLLGVRLYYAFTGPVLEHEVAFEAKMEELCRELGAANVTCPAPAAAAAAAAAVAEGVPPVVTQPMKPQPPPQPQPRQQCERRGSSYTIYCNPHCISRQLNRVGKIQERAASQGGIEEVFPRSTENLFSHDYTETDAKRHLPQRHIRWADERK